MIPDFGLLALWLSLALTFLQTIAGGLAAAPRAPEGQPKLAALASRAALLQCLCLFIAFACLTLCYLQSDFSVLNVFQNSHTQKPLLYKFAGVWGNHEGSMLLWVLVLALFGLGIARPHKSNAPLNRLRLATLAFQGLLGIGFLLFLLLASNPFARLFPAPLEGQDLNPLLQDPALAFHPPFLYVGYVGFSASFAIAMAALSCRAAAREWAALLRPFVLIAWSALTVGIVLGSYWAYYELGWGGWWFWDPVENASLMPWLLGTALLHSVFVVEARDSLKPWTILLAILTFSLSLLGTFLVRSGILTSVHAFALDPERGMWILLMLAFYTGAALLLYALRGGDLGASALFAPISRESALLFNNLILGVAWLTVCVGTLYPLLLELITGDKISVGPPFFNATFVPLMLPLLLLMVIGPLLKWKEDQLTALLPRLRFALAGALAAIVLSLILFERGPVVAYAGMSAGAFLLIGTLADAKRKCRGSLARLIRLPRRQMAMLLAHAGLGIATLGMTGSAIWTTESIARLKIGESLNLAGYTLTLQSVSPVRGPNYGADRARLSVEKGGNPVTVLAPERRFYPAAQKETTEVAIHTTPWSDLYAVLGDPQAEGHEGWTIRAFHHPLVPWIWLGGFIMALGGFIGLLDRRGARTQA